MSIRRSEYLVGTAAEWAEADPILTKGQLGIETPTDAIKIGDGVSRWSALDFVTTGTGEYDMIDGGHA